ncbi:MAG: hypothetical protein QXL86_02635 [Candidatus Aenigmatarchaeota archaeon]
MQELRPNLGNLRLYEIVCVVWIAEAIYGELNPQIFEKILYGNFDPSKEDYLKLRSFLESKRPSELTKKFEDLGQYASKFTIKDCYRFFVSPSDFHKIALKTIHDKVEVNLNIIKEALESQGYKFWRFAWLRILNLLKMGELYKKAGERSYHLKAYPEKMEIFWPFLADENYVLPKK